MFASFQAPDGESQPSTEVDLFISTEKIMVLNTDLKVSINKKYVSTLTKDGKMGSIGSWEIFFEKLLCILFWIVGYQFGTPYSPPWKMITYILAQEHPIKIKAFRS